MWDLWVVSAADAKQKLIFEKQIDILIAKGRLPNDFSYLVIADPEGVKAGSGGATVHIFNQLYAIYDSELLNKKVIVIHSGGFSKRMPVYSIKGKLFSNVKEKGETKKLFEFFTSNYEAFSKKVESGMLIVPGDIQIKLGTNNILKRGTIYGFSAIADIKTASKHGVYITEKENVLIKFLHKKDIETLKQHSSRNNEIDVDTGIIFLPFEVLQKISNTLGIIREPLNLYNDFITPLSRDISEEEYMQSGTDDGNSIEITKYRAKLYSLLKNDSMQVIKLKEKFTHIGTSEEYLNKLTEDDVFIENSIIKKLKHNGRLVIEDSILMGDNYLGKGCMIHSVITSESITLTAGSILMQLPLKLNGISGFVTLKYPVNTNPKITSEFLWGDKCFWFKENRDASLMAALEGDETSNCSFSDCYKYCEINNIISESIEIEDRLAAMDKMEKDTTSHLDEKLLQEAILDITGLKLPHVYRYLSITEDDEYYKKSFNKIRELVCKNLTPEIGQEMSVAKQSIKVMSAVRINISGGWTDTPPYCYENGGKVINLSVLPDNKYPIEVSISTRDDGKLKFECLDCNLSVMVENLNDLKSNIVDQNFLIHKNVSMATGLITENHIRGMNISTYSKLPNGSGLGISSILVNACLIGIFEVFDIAYDNDYLINKTLQVEQMMGCGGGWQDQAGVNWPGIKIIETKPGLPPKYECKTYDISNDFKSELNERLVLIYSGKRRKSKNILRKVISNYLLYENNICKTYKLKNAVTEELDRVIMTGSIEGLANIMSKSYNLNKKLDGGCSNNTIEKIIEILKEYIQDYTMCGAGGGGYLVVVLKAGFDCDDIRNELQTKCEFSGVDVVKCCITDKPIQTVV